MKSSQFDKRRRRVDPVRTLRTGAAAGVIALTGAALVVPPGSAQATTGTSEHVVKVVTRAPYGKMLATEFSGRSLYETAGTCTGSCLNIWPPLVMAAGKTVPTGVTGLETASVKVGTKTELQVTYFGKRLYRFYLDSGSSVDGNGVGGFKVAKLA